MLCVDLKSVSDEIYNTTLFASVQFAQYVPVLCTSFRLLLSFHFFFSQHCEIHPTAMLAEFYPFANLVKIVLGFTVLIEFKL